MLSKYDIQHIANLSRIRLTEKEAENFADNLSSVLSYVSQLKEAESDVPSLSEKGRGDISDDQLRESDINNVWREDEDSNQELGSMGKRLVDMAPEKKNGYVKVKRIL